MAQSAVPPPVGTPGFKEWLTDLFNRTQKRDEEYEPPSALGAANRIVLRDTNGVRYAVTVSTAGAIVVTAL